MQGFGKWYPCILRLCNCLVGWCHLVYCAAFIFARLPWLSCLSVRPSVCMCLCLIVFVWLRACMVIYLFYICVYEGLHLFVSVLVFVCVCLHVCLVTCLFVCMYYAGLRAFYACLRIYLSASLFPRSICLHVRFSFYLFSFFIILFFYIHFFLICLWCNRTYVLVFVCLFLAPSSCHTVF